MVEEPSPEAKSLQNSIRRIAVILPIKNYPDDPLAEDVMIGVNKLAREFNGTIHGIQEMVEFGSEVEFRIFTTTGGNDNKAVSKITESLRSLNLDTFELVIGAGFHYSLPFLEINDDYPDQQFIALDAVIGDFNGTNILGVLFQVNEAAFIAGAVAGVEYMDLKMGTNTEVIVDYVGSFGDYDGGYRLAEDLYNQNVTCIYQAAGTAGNGIMDAARDNSRWVIGVDLDQGLEAALRGDPHKHILTSTQKKWGNGLYLICKEYLTTGRLPENSLTVGMAEDCSQRLISPWKQS
ncbi:MAG TPA: hypothetical protein DCO79_10975 [Spirochaeta sp.]|nr:hypothetical protein [Spirochaeta sp.]